MYNWYTLCLNESKNKAYFMEDIELKALQTYQKNLTYFQNYHPELFQKLSLLEIAIESGEYTPAYDLIYQDGYFDIYDLKHKNFFYGKDSIEESKRIVKRVNGSKKESVIETFYRVEMTSEVASEIDAAPLDYNPLRASATLINYVDEIGTYSGHIKQIFKYLFLGVGLGLHLEGIHNKIKAPVYFIVEDNIEIFKLSLFVTDYSLLGESSEVFFSIMESDDAFRTQFYGFLEKGFIDNSYLKYTMFSESYLEKVKIMQDYIVTQSSNLFPYSKQLAQSIEVPYYLVNGYKFLDISQHHSASPLGEKPLLLIAAGPSLGYNEAWLKEHHHRFTIITILSALKTLQRLGIKPDIITHLDAHLELSMRFFKDLDMEFFKDALILFAADVAKEVTDIFDKERVYLFELSTEYIKEYAQVIPGASIGEVAYSLSLILGSRELYLLGLDLALDPRSGATHAADHFRSEKLDLDKNSNFGSLTQTLFEVKGNLLERVPTTSVLKTSIERLDSGTDAFKQEDQQIYNLSNGAYFEGTIPMKIDSLDMNRLSPIDKDTNRQQLYNFFDQISDATYFARHRTILTSKLELARELKKVIMDYETKVFLNETEYFRGIHELMLELGGDKKSVLEEDLYNIFSLYFRLVMGYISDMFNTKELTNEKRHIKKINALLIKQLHKIIDRYIVGVERYI
jgi:hypothetical protein